MKKKVLANKYKSESIDINTFLYKNIYKNTKDFLLELSNFLNLNYYDDEINSELALRIFKKYAKKENEFIDLKGYKNKIYTLKYKNNKLSIIIINKDKRNKKYIIDYWRDLSMKKTQDFNIDIIKDKLYKILKQDEDFKDFKIQCIMVDPKNINNSYGIIMEDGELAYVELSKKEVNKAINPEFVDVGEDDIFYNIEENGYKIGYMSPLMHYALWQELSSDNYKESEYQNAIKTYFQYCKDNNITKDYIDKEINYDGTYDLGKVIDSVLNEDEEEQEQ